MGSNAAIRLLCLHSNPIGDDAAAFFALVLRSCVTERGGRGGRERKEGRERRSGGS